ncbi:MAG TPA: acetyl-CoA C-acetyltransferase [Pantanalinema sp.]
MSTAYILDALRTPRGRGKAEKGALSRIHPQELLAQVIKPLVERQPIEAADVEDVIVGCVSQVGVQGANLARNAVLTAGWPHEVTGVTLNRFCSSGLQAVNFAAMGIMAGAQELVVAGGVESMSLVPLGSDQGALDGNNPTLRKKLVQVPQGISADLIATLEGFSREDVDRFALTSQERAAEAIRDARFSRSLVGVRDPLSGAIALEADELPRAETTRSALAGLKASFEGMGATAVGPAGETLDQLALARYPQAEAIRHVHTAGNSSGLADGAAAVLLASEDYVRRHGLKPRARIRAMATQGSEPVIMLTGPEPATRKALKAAGMRAEDVDLWEINEAFAAVVLQVMRALELDPARVNVNGGAIALGHPLGATGAMLLGTALDELERRGLGTALVTMCIGGGQGIATVIERI